MSAAVRIPATDPATWFPPVRPYQRSSPAINPRPTKVPDSPPRTKAEKAQARRDWLLTHIGGKDDPLWILEVREERHRQKQRMLEHAARSMPKHPRWWRSYNDRLHELRTAHQPIRKETGPFMCSGGPFDPDSFGYWSVAVRALEDW